MCDGERGLILKNDELEMAVQRPGTQGTYCGTRFAWAGIVSGLEWRGVRMFGPWREGDHPLDEHDTVTGMAGEFGMGIADMPSPPGFEEAAPGEEFVKIGVGVLRRPDAAPYSFGRGYELVRAAPWRVTATPTRVEMEQRLEHAVCGYVYRYVIELDGRGAAFVTRHHLTNVGDGEIRQTHYSHNFVVIDGHPTGPAFELEFPFEPRLDPPLEPVASLDGHVLKFREEIPRGEARFTAMAGFGSTAADNGVIVRNRDVGVELHITGDRPLRRYHFFATPGTVCPEPFIDLHLAPGETMSWQHRYELEVCIRNEHPGRDRPAHHGAQE